MVYYNTAKMCRRVSVAPVHGEGAPDTFFSQRLVVSRLLCLMAMVVMGYSGACLAHPAGGTVTGAAARFLETLSVEQRNAAAHGFDDSERFAFRWTPGRRSGITLGDLNARQNEALKALMHHVVSHAGQERVDAILATEAALGVLTGSPGYRDPKLYYTSVFGAPGPGQRWGLRFEGHHLSINMTFDGDRILSASPLFLGANQIGRAHV